MSDVNKYEQQLKTLQKAQKYNEAAAMRAKFEEEEAKKKVVEAFESLKNLGYKSPAEAQAAADELSKKIEDDLNKAADILGVSL